MPEIRPSSPVRRRRQALLATAVAGALAAPAPAFPAFLQQTTLEGAVGNDIGGIWLSVQNLVPEFRISFQKQESGPAIPVEIGPVPPELEPITGPKPAGVVIKSCTNARFCTDNGLVVGDILVKVNSTEIADAPAFEKAVANLPTAILLSVRRPALQMTTARLFKIRYEGATTAEGQAEEKVDVRVLDVTLPFAAKLEESRGAHKLFDPDADQKKELGAKWQELPDSKPPLFMNGTHRFVAKAAFDESLTSDRNLKDASFAMLLNMEGNPLLGGGKVIDLYGIESLAADEIKGNYVTATIANAPFPINIEFRGRFRMFRVAPWSDADDKLRAERYAKENPPEDLSKFKTLPDVPEVPAP